MSYLDQTLLFIISLAANIFSAFAGGGAGLIQFPALIFLGLPFGLALATHKVASVALGVGATLRFLRGDKLSLKLMLVILSFGLPGVVLGANVIIFVADRHAEILLGILTTSLGCYSIFKPDLGIEARHLPLNATKILGGGLVLFIIGVLNGSLTSGTGLFVTLWLVGYFGLDYKTAVAHTLVMVGLFWNGVGALTLGLLVQIQWQWLPALLFGSLLGGYFGAHLAIIKANKWIKRSFEFVTIVVGISLLF
ncbi:MAG: sulfite exporter TauE/SafE family protein [Thiohalomonadales bacterium]